MQMNAALRRRNGRAMSFSSRSPYVAAILVLACGDPIEPAVDAGRHLSDAATDASPCGGGGGSCDDGDPATEDSCALDRCEHRRCDTDRECDDGNIATTDRCLLDLATATWMCGHGDADGNCAIDVDCYDGVDCTRDSCGDGARCRRTWIPGCSAPAPNVLRVCPKTATVGGPCEHDGAMSYDCRVSDAPCADWLHCVGGTFDARYVRVETVRPGCDAGDCPAELPAGTCTPDRYCDYAVDDLAIPGRVYCECVDRSNPTIEWLCSDNDPCPSSPPADGAPVDRTPVTGGADCYYGDYVCRIDPTEWTWSCVSSEPMFCPFAAPAPGDSCELPSECRYYGPESASDPVTTYRGVCTCDGASWRCTPNETADCPTEQPRADTALDLCSPSIGNRHCWYPPTEGDDVWTRCHCDPPSDPNLWRCERTLHY
jgi:hypothetical protein